MEHIVKKAGRGSLILSARRSKIFTKDQSPVSTANIPKDNNKGDSADRLKSNKAKRMSVAGIFSSSNINSSFHRPGSPIQIPHVLSPYEKKIVLAQSLVRMYLQRKKYRNTSKFS